MKLTERNRLVALYDAYGPLLTKSQQEIIKEYLYYDLTGAEIAAEKNISRQAVKDAVTKAINKLEEYDKKLKFIAKMKKLTKNQEDK